MLNKDLAPFVFAVLIYFIASSYAGIYYPLSGLNEVIRKIQGRSSDDSEMQ